MIKLEDFEGFKRSLDQISTFTSECNLRVNDDGLSIRAFDNAQMLYIEYNVPKTSLSYSSISSTLIGLNISEISKVVSKLVNTDNVMIDFDDNNFYIVAESDYRREYKFSIKDIDDQEFDSKSINYELGFSLTGSFIKDIFSSARLVSDSVVFDVKTDSLEVESSGHYSSYKTYLNVHSSKPFRARFSSTYLSNIVKAVASDNNVSIAMSEGKPIFLSYSIGNNNLKYFLAPMFI